MERPIWVRREIFPLFDQGRDLELRVVDYINTTAVCEGQVICFNRTKRRKVVAIRTHTGAKELLEKENPNRIYPGKSKEEIILLLTTLYGPFILKLLPIVVWELAHP